MSLLGKRVMCCSNGYVVPDSTNAMRVNKCGTIIKESKDMCIIEFDEYIKGHNGRGFNNITSISNVNGYGKNGYCWNVMISNIYYDKESAIEDSKYIYYLILESEPVIENVSSNQNINSLFG